MMFADKNANGIVETPGEITQENHYYPFGLGYEGPWLMNDVVARDNKYQYNGKEWNDDWALNWNDYGARWYDPAIGRWGAVDPLAEKYKSISSYVYVANNPLLYIDPDGMRLIINFENKEARNLYKKIVNDMFEGQFKLKFTTIKGSSNKYQVDVVGVKGKSDKGKLSESGQKFYGEFTNVTQNTRYTADMDVVIDDPNVPIGKYIDNVLDIGDIAALPTHDLCNVEQCGPTQGGKIIHETVEQFGKAVDGVPRGSDDGFNANHDRATDAENQVNGNKRLQDKWNGNKGIIQNYKSGTFGNTSWSFEYGQKKGQRTRVKKMK